MAIVERKNKSGTSYQVKVRDPSGAWYPCLTFMSREEALLEEGRLLGLKRKGVALITQDGRTFTVDDFWEVWSVENRADVSRGWKISQDQMYRDYVQPALGATKMKDVGVPQIGKILNGMKDKGLSDQMRKHVYTLMRKMFADAVEYYEILVMNPVRAKFHRPRVITAERPFLHPAEAWKLLESVRDHYLGPAIWLQTLAALRPSEVQALRWRSIQFEAGQILICSAYNRKVGQLQDYPKQELWAYVPMVEGLKELLRGLKKGPNDFVAPGPNGMDMLSYSTYHKVLKRLCRYAGVTELTPHELRHTCTELFYNAGASTEDVRRLLNHASLAATAKYIHRTDERLTRVADNVINLFPNVVPLREQSPEVPESSALVDLK